MLQAECVYAGEQNAKAKQSGQLRSRILSSLVIMYRPRAHSSLSAFSVAVLGWCGCVAGAWSELIARPRHSLSIEYRRPSAAKLHDYDNTVPDFLNNHPGRSDANRQSDTMATTQGAM
jgi:hypothetical protein